VHFNGRLLSLLIAQGASPLSTSFKPSNGGLPCGPAPAPARVYRSRSRSRYRSRSRSRYRSRSGVRHYWIVDPDRKTLSVYRLTADGYLMALMAEPGDRERAEPFGDVDVGAVFGDEET
jgi:Putative restriction endonuclease